MNQSLFTTELVLIGVTIEVLGLFARDAMTQVEVLGGLREVSKTINKHLLDIDYLTLVASN